MTDSKEKIAAQKCAQQEAKRLGKAVDDGYGNTWLPAKVPTCEPNYGRRCEP